MHEYHSITQMRFSPVLGECILWLDVVLEVLQLYSEIPRYEIK